MAQLGRVAQPGDVVEAQGVIFEVEAVRGMAVQTVLVRLTRPNEIKEG
jgi:CBS domain containing-hemolysin-like protein